MVQQSKIFFTALFGRLFLGRILSQVRGMRTAQHGMCFARCILCMHTMRAPCMHVLPHGTPSQPKWCALVCLVLGVLLITLEAMPSAQACDRQTDTWADGKNGCMDGWVDRWMDGPTGLTLVLYPPPPRLAPTPARCAARSWPTARFRTRWASWRWRSTRFCRASRPSTLRRHTHAHAHVHVHAYKTATNPDPDPNPTRTSTPASNAQVLKTTVLTVWDRNLQLAFYSMLIYGPRASHGQAGPSARPPLGVARPLLWQCLPPTKEPSGHCQAAWSRRARP